MLLNGTRCDKFSKAVTKVRTHPDKYAKEFDAVVTFLTYYLNKRGLTLSIKLATVA